MDKESLEGMKMLTVNFLDKNEGKLGLLECGKDKVLCVVNEYSYVVFNKINEKDRNEIIRNHETLKGDPTIINKMKELYKLNDKEAYPDDYIEILNVRDLENSVYLIKIKNGTGVSQYKERINHPHSSSNRKMFNTVCNVELMFEVCRCVGGRRVLVHYPKGNKDPIWIIGKYGKGMLLPVMIKNKEKKDDN